MERGTTSRMRFGENERERLEAVIASFQHVTVFAGNIIEGAHLLQVNYVGGKIGGLFGVTHP